MLGPKKFKMHGGRAGHWTFVEGERAGRLEWEMLTGEQAFVMYPGGSWWLTPREERIKAGELRRLARELAVETSLSFVVAFPDGDEMFAPT